MLGDARLPRGTGPWPATLWGIRSAGLLLWAAITVAGCSSRERSNPFDPGSPETQGRPSGFRAVAGDRSVRLSWSTLEAPGLLGYALSRRAPGESSFSPLGGGMLPPATDSYSDTAVLNDSTYAYRLAFVLSTGLEGPSAEALARPGPGAIWVLDSGANRVQRLTPDGRHPVLSLPAFDNPGALAIEPGSGVVWASSRLDGGVAAWDEQGRLLGAEGGFGAPGAIAPVPGTLSAWIADELTGEVLQWTIGSLPSVRGRGFRLPSDVAHDAAGGGVWVADRLARRLTLLDPGGSESVSVELPGRCWKIAVDPRTGDVWISYPEEGLVERRDSRGGLAVRLGGLARPFSIAVDPGTGWAWVALAAGGAVVALDGAGAEVVRVRGLPEPRGIALDPRTGEVWVSTLGEGDGSGSVWRLTSSGTVAPPLPGFVRPFAIAVDPQLVPPLPF